MKRTGRVIAILGLVSGYLFLPPPASFAFVHDVVHVRCGRLLFDASKPAIAPAATVIKDGKITAIGNSLPVPPNAHEFDLPRDTVAPGFIVAPIHLLTGPRGQNPSSDLAALRASKDMQYASDSGVAAARVLGAEGFINVALKDAIEAGPIQGPHLVPAGTENGAGLLGFDNFGTPAVGKEGDSVAFDADPTSDIQAVKPTQSVVLKVR